MPDLNRLELAKVNARQRELVNRTTPEAIFPRCMQSTPTACTAMAMQFDEDVCIGVRTTYIARVNEDSVRELCRWTSTIV